MSSGFLDPRIEARWLNTVWRVLDAFVEGKLETEAFSYIYLTFNSELFQLPSKEGEELHREMWWACEDYSPAWMIAEHGPDCPDCANATTDAQLLEIATRLKAQIAAECNRPNP